MFRVSCFEIRGSNLELVFKVVLELVFKVVLFFVGRDNLELFVVGRDRAAAPGPLFSKREQL